jgi:hypothetical protein
MLKNVGLPEPWIFRELIDVGSAKDRALEDTFKLSESKLGADDVLDGGMLRTPKTETGRRNMNHSWELIREGPDGREVYVRLQLDDKGATKVSSVVFLPHGKDWAVTGQALRSLPVAAIEEAVRNHSFEVEESLHKALGVPLANVLAPLGSPRGDENFSAKVARQFTALKETHANPTGEMAKLNDVGLSTAQGWITASRKQGFLPPGRPGRAG